MRDIKYIHDERRKNYAAENNCTGNERRRIFRSVD
jgi:hypothetical protein